MSWCPGRYRAGGGKNPGSGEDDKTWQDMTDMAGLSRRDRVGEVEPVFYGMQVDQMMRCR